MDSEQLRTAVALLQHGSVNRTAARLDIAPSSVSDRVRRLEGELGSALFVRSARGMRPTPAGREFLEVSARVLDQLDAAGAALRSAPTVVAVGAQASVADTLLPPVLEGLQAHQPALRVRLVVDADRLELLHQVGDEELDAAVVLDTGDTLGGLGFGPLGDSYDFLDLREVALHTVAGPDHALVGRPITVDELRAGSTLLGQEERCAFWMATRTWLGPGTDLIKVGGIPQIKQWVGEGRGVAVLPDFAVHEELETGRVVALDLDTPPLTLRLAWRADRAAEQPLTQLLYALSQA